MITDIFDSINSTLTYSETTEAINITVIPKFYSHNFSKDNGLYIWHYDIKIENLSNMLIQILGRHWLVFDAKGNLQEVKGSGIIGYQPILNPEENFKYTSEVGLFTDSGFMSGEYYATDLESLREFTIKIPSFSLDVNIDKTKAN